jgi:hypothetical protein
MVMAGANCDKELKIRRVQTTDIRRRRWKPEVVGSNLDRVLGF